jgi:short-subunit dehydrogenase
VEASEFEQRYGPWAFVAGASMGIGAALAHGAASRGLNVVMLARGRELLTEVADDVAKRHGVQTKAVAADLGQPAPVIRDVVADATDGLDIGLFVYNAAVAPHGMFVDTELDVQLLSVAVNCSTSVALCNLLAPPMVERGRGGIALISSLAAVAGAVKFATYNAGKAFQWILGESLWAELGDHGVDVTTCFVGATSSPNYNSFKETLDTELCGRPDTDDALDRARSRLMDPRTPEEVAESVYTGLGKGPVCFSDPNDAWVGEQCLAMPRTEAIAVWRGVQETSTRTPARQAR